MSSSGDERDGAESVVSLIAGTEGAVAGNGAENENSEQGAGSLNNSLRAVTVEEILAAAVRIANQRTVGEGQGQGNKKQISNAEIAALLPNFHGGSDENVDTWFSRADMVKSTYDLTDEVMVLIVVQKLKDAALNWYHSKPVYATLKYAELKYNLVTMFSCREDKISLMRKFDSRKWRRNETFASYYHEKIILGNRLGMEEPELISYLIDGFDNPTLQSQARIRGFNNLSTLLEVMNSLSMQERGIRNQNTSYTPRFSGRGGLQRNTASNGATDRKMGSTIVKCFNCDVQGHFASECQKPRRIGACFGCGQQGHRKVDCPNRKERQSGQQRSVVPADSTTMTVETGQVIPPAYYTPIKIPGDGQEEVIQAMIDTGSGISLIKSKKVPLELRKPYVNRGDVFTGINKTKLNTLGIYCYEFTLDHVQFIINFHIVDDDTMFADCLLGRDFITNPLISIEFQTDVAIIKPVCSNSTNSAETDILSISILQTNEEQELSVGKNVDGQTKTELHHVFDKHYVKPERKDEPETKFYTEITVSKECSFSHKPRRLSYTEKAEVKEIIDDLLEKNVIKKSHSPYCSPIVLVKKKNGKSRMCVDFRELNKFVVKDRFPIPLIDDQLDQLKGKKWFTKLDLKDAFYHVRVRQECTKYLSFVTPQGQYEFVKLPFGFCNSPAVFTRFIYEVFKKFLDAKQILIYMDDILIATETIQENLKILTAVFDTLVKNLLELRLDKCVFLENEIEYLGYVVNEFGISPNPANVKAIEHFPIPKNNKQVHSFLGLASYFRRFLPNFSVIAKPLYNLIRKNQQFKFEEQELVAFETIKQKLVAQPILSIYSPHSETELHCDASTLGFGAILLQKQSDSKFHPVSYFSKRTSECEQKYHSYELEFLSIIYAVKRFDVYLKGIPFKIVTDCNSVKLAMSKKDTVPRVMRWVMFLQNYEYQIEHRGNDRMKHVDCLSRVNSILILEDNTFDQVLAIKQDADVEIGKIRDLLEKSEHKLFEMRNGLVYRKEKDKLLFYIPNIMENTVMSTYHDNVGHVGIDKTVELIRRTYWFPEMKRKVKDYINNCLKCIMYSPNSGKVEGELHSIPKGTKPFNTIHIDHYGPLEKCPKNAKYIFLIVDAFTKFVKLYPCKSTGSKEVVKHMSTYFNTYSTPLRVVSDRGTAFTSQYFKEFMNECNIQHVLIATGTPRANGQAERVNRVITPMLAKFCEETDQWDKHLSQVEYALNNTINKSIGTTPSKLLFGVNQRGEVNDSLRDYLVEVFEEQLEPIEDVRAKASEMISKSQKYNEKYYNQAHKSPTKYNEGDYVVITNTEVTPGYNKKLIPKYKGPYVVKKVLPNDRYVISDIDGFQITQIPFEGTFESSRLRKWSDN